MLLHNNILQQYEQARFMQATLRTSPRFREKWEQQSKDFLRFSFLGDIISRGHTENNVFPELVREWNDSLPDRKGRIIANTLFTMKAIYMLLYDEMESMRQYMPDTYLAYLNPIADTIPVKVSRPRLVAACRSNGCYISERSIYSHINRLIDAGIIAGKRNLSTHKEIVVDEKGAIKVVFKPVKDKKGNTVDGRGDIELHVSKKALAFTQIWCYAQRKAVASQKISNTENQRVTKPINIKLPQCPNEFNKTYKKEINNNSEKSESFKSGKDFYRASTIVDEDRELKTKEAGRVLNSAADAPPESMPPPMSAEKEVGQVRPSKESPMAKAAEELAKKIGLDFGVVGSPSPADLPAQNPMTPQALQYYTRLRQHGKIDQCLQGLSGKELYAHLLYFQINSTIYRHNTDSYVFHPKVMEECVWMLTKILDNVGIPDTLKCYKVVLRAVQFVHTHLLLHTHKKRKLYNIKSWLNPCYSGGLNDAMQNWVLGKYKKNILAGSVAGTYRRKWINARNYMETRYNELLEEVAEHRSYTRFSNDYLLKLDRLNWYFANKKYDIPKKISGSLRAEFQQRCLAQLDGLRHLAEVSEDEVELIVGELFKN